MVLDVQDWIMYVSAEVEDERSVTTVQVTVPRDAAGAPPSGMHTRYPAHCQPGNG